MLRSAPRPAPFDQHALLAALRARVARLDGTGQARHGEASIPVCDGLPLPGGGLARAALHEILTAAPGCGVAFAAMLLARTGGTVLWINAPGDEWHAWPPGLAGFGLNPAQLVFVQPAQAADALWAAEEALRCPAVSGALLAFGEKEGSVALDLTATRRLQLAAEAGGALGLLLRPDTGRNAATSTALTRWRITPLSAACPASPRWRLELLRIRGSSPGGPWDVTWQPAEQRLTLDEAAHQPCP